MKESKIRKLSLMAGSKYLSLYSCDYENKAGNIKNWTIASRKSHSILKEQYEGIRAEKVDAVVMVAMHRDTDKLVLVRQFRVPINDYIYELPAGLIDGNEDVKTALRRELKEETGLELLDIDINKSKEKVYISPGMTDESVALMYCTCRGTVCKDYLEEDEDLECVLVSREEAGELLKSDSKIDIKAYIILQSFANNHKQLF